MSSFTPSVSIVVPVYNGSRTIEHCITSLLNQDYPKDKYEIIVVENGSTDNTPEFLKNYPVRLIHCNKPGPSEARNNGIAYSRSDIIAFTDADCVAAPNWLTNLTQPYINPKVGGVGGEILAYRHANRNFVEIFSDDYSPLINYGSENSGEFLPRLYTANASYRRELINQIGGFRPYLITGQDVDLSWRLQLQTDYKLQYAPEATIYHHHRTTKAGLARQYRRYGFGEIMLDTLYRQHPGYPRNRSYQLKRIMKQLYAMLRYTVSMGVRRIRLTTGRATPYEAAVPGLWFLIEWNNIRGKIDGLIATRLMKDPQIATETDRVPLITRLYGT